MQWTIIQQVHGTQPCQPGIGFKLLLQLLRDVESLDICHAQLADVYARPDSRATPAKARVRNVCIQTEALLAAYKARVRTIRLYHVVLIVNPSLSSSSKLRMLVRDVVGNVRHARLNVLETALCVLQSFNGPVGAADARSFGVKVITLGSVAIAIQQASVSVRLDIEATVGGAAIIRKGTISALQCGCRR